MTRKRYLFATALVATLAGPAAADPDPFVAGNAAATTGDHTAAAAAFEHAIEVQGWSAGTLFDLGNAYASNGRPGPAILAFERAHLLAPRDHAITANLAHTRDAAGVTTPAASWINGTLGALSADEWTWIAIAAGILACAGMIGYAWSVRRRGTGALAATGVVAGALAMAAAVHVAPSPCDAIVVHADTARIAPFAAAEAAFTAPEGEDVRIEQERGDFVYVRDGDRSGWLPRSTIERVVARDRHVTHA